jgi:hypothetical protein
MYTLCAFPPGAAPVVPPMGPLNSVPSNEATRLSSPLCPPWLFFTLIRQLRINNYCKITEDYGILKKLL